tara:strand:- start:197 stop:538 length:342 start_codon:yes stop_codon:yes gene_type:complete
MDVQWDISNVLDSEATCWNKVGEDKYELNAVTQSIIDLTALVGVNKLTPRTVGVFVQRLGIMKVIGYPVPDDVTTGVLHKHVGVETSAKVMDYRKFKNQIFASLEQASRDVIG